MGSLLGREFEAAGIPDGFGVYSAIGALGRVTPTDLAQVVGMRPTTLSGHIERLVRGGVVSRIENPDDGRSYLLELAERGRPGVERRERWPEASARGARPRARPPRRRVLDALEALDAALRRALDDSTTRSNFYDVVLLQEAVCALVCPLCSCSA